MSEPTPRSQDELNNRQERFCYVDRKHPLIRVLMQMSLPTRKEPVVDLWA